MQDFKEHKQSRNHDTIKKKHNNFPVTDHKEMKICDFPNKEFKIVILRKCSEGQNNTT